MKYCVIIPAHNEEQFLLQVLQSVANQTLAASQVIIVNDNSTDLTLAIAQEFSENQPNFSVISVQSKPEHQPGSKVIQAFNHGVNALESDFDFIVKMDADVLLPDNYFSQIAEIFAGNSKIGIAGGLVNILKGDQWIFENIANKDHVRGPVKSYSKACYEMIGGLRSVLGWDTLDELIAQHQGFAIAVEPRLQIKHLRPTTSAYSSRSMKKHGAALYAMRYRIALTKLTALKTAWRFKSISLYFEFVFGFIQAYLNKESFVVSKEEGKFIRAYRWKKILNKAI